jgi:hypothetical protein
MVGQASSTGSCMPYNCINVSYNIDCYNFKSWSEINEVINELHKNKDCKIAPYQIFLKPSAPIQLTSELNISFGFTISADLNSSIILIAGVTGVEVCPWPASFYGLQQCLTLSLSTVQFYVNNTPPWEYTCDPGLIPAYSPKSVSFFSTYIGEIDIDYGNTYGSASQTVCPFVFKNSRLSQLTLQYQVDSFLFVSLFRFQEVNFTRTFSINSTILELYLHGYNYKLDTNILHPLVFENISILEAEGTIQLIETTLFKHFKMLTEFTLSLTSIENLFHQIGIEWMNYVNINSSIVIWSILPYSYPEQDFCIFAQFPVNRSIFLDISELSL